MPKKDFIHDTVKQALIKNGWEITEDPYVISYGERFLFVDLGADGAGAADRIEGRFIGATHEDKQIAVEIKEFRSRSAMFDLEHAIGQYVLYRLLLGKVDPEREIYLAITEKVYDEIFTEPVGKLAVSELPLRLIVVNLEKVEVKQWIIPKNTEKQ